MMTVGSILLAMAAQAVTAEHRIVRAAPAAGDGAGAVAIASPGPADPVAGAARPAPALAPELEPLGFLVGACWRGTFPDGRQTDTHCFAPMLGGRFVRDRHVVEGAPQPYSGETIYRWDMAARHIRYDYYASDGSHSGGTAGAAPDGLRFPEEIHRSPEGREMTIRSAWIRDGADAYVALSEARDGAGWRELWRMRFERVSAAPAG